LVNLIDWLTPKKKDETYIGSFNNEIGESFLVFDPMYRKAKRVHGEELKDCRPYDLDATLITSRMKFGKDGVRGGQHAPVLDIDIPHQVFPSTQPGHSHIWFDTQMSWRTYKRLLRALRAAGIIEDGYYRASVQRGYTAVRLPWVKKKL
jgi:hypothetical protein